MIRLLLHMVSTLATCAWHACVYKLHTWSHIILFHSIIIHVNCNLSAEFIWSVSFSVYGWKGTFPREVRKGDVLDMAVGYIKGVPDIPRFFDVIFNSSGKWG